MSSFCSVGFSNIFTYSGSELDAAINWVAWILLLLSLIHFLSASASKARRFPNLAPYFWLPFTVVLFGLQILADCAADETGISAVWSAYGGFLCASYFTLPTLFANVCRKNAKSALAGQGRKSVMASTAFGLLVWAVCIVYYAATADLLTTFAHVVASMVGAFGTLAFRLRHDCS